MDAQVRRAERSMSALFARSRRLDAWEHVEQGRAQRPMEADFWRISRNDGDRGFRAPTRCRPVFHVEHVVLFALNLDVPRGTPPKTPRQTVDPPRAALSGTYGSGCWERSKRTSQPPSDDEASCSAPAGLSAPGLTCIITSPRLPARLEPTAHQVSALHTARALTTPGDRA